MTEMTDAVLCDCEHALDLFPSEDKAFCPNCGTWWVLSALLASRLGPKEAPPSTEPAPLKPGVQLRPEPCYTIIVVGSDEGPDFEGGFSHYETEVDAAEAVAEMQDNRGEDDTRVLEIRQEDFRCTQGVSLCGTLYVYEGDAATSHFVDRKDLINCTDVHAIPGTVYWQVIENNVMLCDDVACRTCRPEPDGDPLTIPVPQVAGQLPLEFPDV
jgi:hypothetical protein